MAAGLLGCDPLVVMVLLLFAMVGLVFGATWLVMDAFAWAALLAVVVLLGGAVLGNSVDID